MHLKTWDNIVLIAARARRKGIPETVVTEIYVRICDDAFPPYEFWAELYHPNAKKMELMVARGIARWIEQQNEYLQDILLNSLNLIPFDLEITKASLTVWGMMKPHDWLKIHAVDVRPNADIWINALLHLRRAIHEDTWQEIRNYQAQFFMPDTR